MSDTPRQFRRMKIFEDNPRRRACPRSCRPAQPPQSLPRPSPCHVFYHFHQNRCSQCSQRVRPKQYSPNDTVRHSGACPLSRRPAKSPQSLPRRIHPNLARGVGHSAPISIRSRPIAYAAEYAIEVRPVRSCRHLMMCIVNFLVNGCQGVREVEKRGGGGFPWGVE